MKLSVVAAAAIDQLNKSVMDRWFDYIDQFINIQGKENETRKIDFKTNFR